VALDVTALVAGHGDLFSLAFHQQMNFSVTFEMYKSIQQQQVNTNIDASVISVAVITCP
jgi:hypothetical protein